MKNLQKLSLPKNLSGLLLVLLSVIFVFIFFLGCQSDSNTKPKSNTSIPTVISIQPSPEPAPLPTATISSPQPPYSTWLDPRLPSAIQDLISENPSFNFSLEKQNASILISAETGTKIGSWVYLVVVPFPSVLEELSIAEIISVWETGEMNNSGITKFLLSEETKNMLTFLWGEANHNTVSVIDDGMLLATIWENPDAIVIMPFEQVTPDWKILTINGINPLAPDFVSEEYPLSLPIYLTVDSKTMSGVDDSISLTNFDQSKLTSVALTGVTALVRDTAVIMEEKGYLYPAGDIQNLLESVDITHVSNEVPFAEDCPEPDSSQESLNFCSKDGYIKLLEAIGVDIIELSGDHFGDWGPDAMLHTLDLYRERNWLTYGGGETLQTGLNPVYIEHNGNRLAFIGCNGKALTKYATATETNPGASPCNFEWMTKEISRLSQQGYTVIATMQHEEVNSFSPVAIQQRDFRLLADAGAVIVSGSQAHHPQAFEFRGSSFIHYGLGNLFFDQWNLAKYYPKAHANQDKAFIDIHYFYNGSHINTRLITLQFIDNARPRLMTSEERLAFLQEVFSTSLWNLPR